MIRIFFRPLPAVFLFLSAASLAAANEVTLKNGDRISGTIVAQNDDSVSLATAYAGTIKIDRKHIDRVGGDIHAPANAAAPAAASNIAPAAKPAAPPTPRLFGGRFMGLLDGWDGNANIGFSYTSGNSNTTTMATGIRAEKFGGRDHLTVYARSHRHTNHGGGRFVTTQNAIWGGGRYDRKAGDRIFGFVSYDFERDRPKKLNFRSVAGGGVGHNVIRGERTQLELIAGAAWNRTWQPGPETDTPEGLIGSTLRHKFNDRLRFQKTFTYFQNITDTGERRFLFDATLSVDVTKRIGFHITLGDRFNNDPLGSAKKNDLLVTTGMKWNFGRKK
jgi:putative salt-induced outer membrane protein YdiY